MGKSAAAKLLQEKGCSVVDTDVLARHVVEPGEPALKEIQARFGADILDKEGRLRREALAKKVFGNPTLRQELEAIVHPRIRALWKSQIQVWRNEGRRFAVVVIPLLFETRAAAEFDTIICVACTSATQTQRLISRRWSGEQIQQRVSAQIPIAEKIAMSHFVVWTEGSLAVHSEQLDRILKSLGS